MGRIYLMKQMMEYSRAWTRDFGMIFIDLEKAYDK